jgi:hypothetical protein
MRASQRVAQHPRTGQDIDCYEEGRNQRAIGETESSSNCIVATVMTGIRQIALQHDVDAFGISLNPASGGIGRKVGLIKLHRNFLAAEVWNSGAPIHAARRLNEFED